MDPDTYPTMMDLAEVNEAGGSAEAIVALLEYIQEEVAMINPLAADLIGMSVLAIRQNAMRLD